MPIRTATPYLVLQGRARQAIEHYRHALGAELESLQHFGDVDRSCPEARRDWVMHAALRLGEATVMLSDGPGEGPVPTSGAVSVALHLDDQTLARTSFARLADGGTVVQPLFDAPWGTLFGVVIDRFGVAWMFDCAKR